MRAFSASGAAEWLERLQAAHIPCGAVNAIPEVMGHPQLAHNQLVVEVDSPAGPIPTVGNPFLVGGVRPGLGAVPGLGEHTAEVLRELGVEPG
jgi:itaconate CoA-transferase